jgi:hypothetical protein
MARLRNYGRLKVLINTRIGPIDDSLMTKEITTDEVNGNKLRKTLWYLNGEEVGCDLEITLAQLALFPEQGKVA